MNDSNGIRWGIIGCGLIAPKFHRSLLNTGEGRVVAAASKSMRRARRLGDKTGIPHLYDSYSRMLEEEDLDAVYIATTHNVHADHALLCLERGIPVLVEKPLTHHASDAERLIRTARARKVFAMEAMWTRFNPSSIRLQQVLADGVIGEVQHMKAEFCVRMPLLAPKMMPWNRMYSPRLAGGALLDLGVYLVAYARMIFGRDPETVESSITPAWTGVDKTTAARFRYPDGAVAEWRCSFREARPRDVVLTGTRGTIHVSLFTGADQFTISRDGEEDSVIHCEKSGFEHEIREVHRDLREGRTESERMPLQESLEIARTMGRVRSSA
ncbi:Gfo/Idh/MocA family protein [Kiritimatiella glycovorans]|uniref:1,5-anhydro-D-fructose reductase n=1 Tax=Kiritimatiella glycovorans TaxID=1307763 RepID=A0A0G3EGE5_9BACT|nr:Gfo/Idh/MocA family oxidoreductase [Kiritimatiella glycovorans]AKJ64482.1 1,5-anhydro-D-fructose reductase [Kiritimatiella glycovorans]